MSTEVPTLTTTDAPAPTQPEHEEYSLIISELTKAKSEKYALELTVAYDETEVPGFAGYTVGTQLYGGASTRKKALSGFHRERAIAAADARVALLEQRLEDFNARQQVWMDAQAAKDES